MKFLRPLISALFLVLLYSCGKNYPSACECSNNLDLIVNYEDNIASTYEGQFNEQTYAACVEKFKKDNDLSREDEVLIKKVYKDYKKECYK